MLQQACINRQKLSSVHTICKAYGVAGHGGICRVPRSIGRQVFRGTFEELQREFASALPKDAPCQLYAVENRAGEIRGFEFGCRGSRYIFRPLRESQPRYFDSMLELWSDFQLFLFDRAATTLSDSCGEEERMDLHCERSWWAWLLAVMLWCLACFVLPSNPIYKSLHARFMTERRTNFRRSLNKQRRRQ
jgi:hypothetical protein